MLILTLSSCYLIWSLIVFALHMSVFYVQCFNNNDCLVMKEHTVMRYTIEKSNLYLRHFISRNRERSRVRRTGRSPFEIRLCDRHLFPHSENSEPFRQKQV
jgi:hypothetical protein